MKLILVSLAALALFTAAALPASADVLFSQSADITAGRWQSETSNSSDGFNQAFDDFSLASDATITNVSWTGFLNPSFTPVNSFTISIYADNFDNFGSPGAVGTLLASTVINGDAGQTRDPTTPSVGPFGVFEFNTAITPFQATAGTTYWISIVGDPSKNSGDVYWAFSDQGDGTFNTFDGNFVTSVGTDLAFTLSNTTVPEPSGLVLDGSGLLVLAGFGRRLFAQKRGK